jgi:hypothetical protein
MNSAKFNHFQAERINTILPQSTSYVLTSSQSGSIIFCDPANYATTINLPEVDYGLNFKFILKSISTTNNIIIKSMNSSFSEANLIYGNGNSANISAYPCSQLKFNSPNQNIGDTIEFICDGTNWFAIWNTRTVISSDQIIGSSV